MRRAPLGTKAGMETSSSSNGQGTATTSEDAYYPDRVGESIEASGADIISLDAVAEESDDLAVEQDGIASLRDIEAEANDPDGLRDRSIVDVQANREAGIAFDERSQPEPDLD